MKDFTNMTEEEKKAAWARADKVSAEYRAFIAQKFRARLERAMFKSALRSQWTVWWEHFEYRFHKRFQGPKNRAIDFLIDVLEKFR